MGKQTKRTVVMASITALLLSFAAIVCLYGVMGGNALRLVPGFGEQKEALSPVPSGFSPPWFCHGIDCPPYRVLPSNSSAYEKGTSTGFMCLFKYISGANEGNQKVEMTAPVSEYITPGQGPFCEDHFTVSFFVPYAFQGKAPAPTASDVTIEKRPAMTVYVASYSGFSDINKLRAAASDLGNELEKEGLAFDTEHIWYAGYDSPFRLFNRHNEVWLVKSDE